MICCTFLCLGLNPTWTDHNVRKVWQFPYQKLYMYFSPGTPVSSIIQELTTSIWAKESWHGHKHIMVPFHFETDHTGQAKTYFIKKIMRKNKFYHKNQKEGTQESEIFTNGSVSLVMWSFVNLWFLGTWTESFIRNHFQC